MRQEIKMPKWVDTFSKYKEWMESLEKDIPLTEFVVTMKRRTNFHPYDFRPYLGGTKVEYLIDDSVSYGNCLVKNFNRVFKFYLVTYQ